MNRIVLFLVLLALPVMLTAQIQSAEMTTYYQDTDETLIPENGAPPPDTDISSSSYLGRIRLQNIRNFPVFEARYLYKQNHADGDLADLRLAGIYTIPKTSLTVKGVLVNSNPDQASSSSQAAGYLMYRYQDLNLAVGMDYADAPSMVDRIYSVRAKYNIKPAVILAGMSSQPNNQERYTFGGIVQAYAQILIGGLIGIWEDESGYCLNIGRFNQFGDFAGMPSFALNHLEVPQTYKWTTFRIMWGARGTHYVRPTFDNPVFSGMLDLDVALILSQLVPDNYRHFDSPLLFLRYDEYGKVALRANYIDTETRFRRFDANISFNPGYGYGMFQAIQGYVSFDRIHNPVFGWQDNRYHVNLGSYLFGAVYTGLTLSSDFDEYTNAMLEIRIQTQLK